MRVFYKYLLALAILLVSPVTGWATQVTVLGTTQSNFHPSGLTAYVTGTCSVSHSVTTVTSSGFRSSWVGLSGFRINIGNADYTVASVPNATTIILTSGYTGSTGTVSFTVYPYVLMRIYALQGFTDSQTLEIIQPGTPGSSAWYKQVACSVISSVLYIPQMVLASTTDAVNPVERGARWFGGLYTPSGALISPFYGLAQFRLNPVPNPQTWAQILAFNSPGSAPPPNFDTYTKAQINALFAASSGGGGVSPSRRIDTGTGLQGGGDLSANRTHSLTNTGVTPGAYTNANITVDAQGRISTASNGTSGGTGTVTSITAGTGLTASPNPITSTGTISLANVLSAGSCTSCDLTYNARGQITVATNGSGGGGGATPGQYVISLNGGGQSIFAGYYWPDAYRPLPVFSYEAWVKPLTSGCGCYVIADGNGGDHSILWGFTDVIPGGISLITGNMEGTTPGLQSFGSVEGLTAGEWGHIAVTWNGANVMTFINGVPSGIASHVGDRADGGVVVGNTQFFIGGSDHNNYRGYISQLRGFEGRAVYTGPFKPNRTFDTYLYPNVHSTINFDFTQGTGPVVPDTSEGFMGRLHHGYLHDANALAPPGSAGPAYVVDPTAPAYNRAVSWPIPTGLINTPPSTPAGAVIFDSFSRANSTLMTYGVSGDEIAPRLGKSTSGTCNATNGSPTVTSSDFSAWSGPYFFIRIGGTNYYVQAITGSTITLASNFLGTTGVNAYTTYTTESGSAGPQPWKISRAAPGYCDTGVPGQCEADPTLFGILNNHAVALSTNYSAMSYVDSGLADVDVSVDRLAQAWSSYETGLTFRRSDGANWWQITVDGTNQLHLCKQVAGTYTCPSSPAASNPTFTKLQVTTQGANIKVYTDGVLQINITDSFNQTATQHGLFYGVYISPFAKFDNFLIKAFP